MRIEGTWLRLEGEGRRPVQVVRCSGAYVRDSQAQIDQVVYAFKDFSQSSPPKGTVGAYVPPKTSVKHFQESSRDQNFDIRLLRRLPIVKSDWTLNRRTVGARINVTGRAFAGQRQIQTYVNDFPEILETAIVESLGSSFPVSARIRWVSLLKQEGCAEYRDGDFLRVLGMQQFADELSAFWPNRGPCWDALGRIEKEGVFAGRVMVEAKSHVDEFYANDTGAKGVSLDKIRTALTRREQVSPTIPR